MKVTQVNHNKADSLEKVERVDVGVHNKIYHTLKMCCINSTTFALPFKGE
jgi:hypothetical protein